MKSSISLESPHFLTYSAKCRDANLCREKEIEKHSWKSTEKIMEILFANSVGTLNNALISLFKLINLIYKQVIIQGISIKMAMRTNCPHPPFIRPQISIDKYTLGVPICLDLSPRSLGLSLQEAPRDTGVTSPPLVSVRTVI